MFLLVKTHQFASMKDSIKSTMPRSPLIISKVYRGPLQEQGFLVIQLKLMQFIILVHLI